MRNRESGGEADKPGLDERVATLEEGVKAKERQNDRLSSRIRELELKDKYQTTEALAEGIRQAVERVATAEKDRLNNPSPRRLWFDEQNDAEHQLLELVRYAGRSGLLIKRD